MAMKVIKTTVHRLAVSMSCGCTLAAEFEDAQCKKPISHSEEATIVRVFNPCQDHSTDVSVSMLKFIISERLDEAIEAAQKTPVHLHSIPVGIEEGDSGGVVAISGGVQSVAKVNKPAAVRSRTQDPTEIKVFNRNPASLAKVGGTQSGFGGLDIIEVDEVPELTPHIEDILASYDKDDESGGHAR